MVQTLLAMYDFYNSIERKNLIDEQRKLSPFNEQLDLFYICLLVGLNNNLKANENDFVQRVFMTHGLNLLRAQVLKIIS